MCGACVCRNCVQGSQNWLIYVGRDKYEKCVLCNTEVLTLWLEYLTHTSPHVRHSQYACLIKAMPT